jgi:hypothetical protein
MRIELPFERNTTYFSVFSSVRIITFLQNTCTEVNGRSNVSLGRKPRHYS